MGGRGIQPSEAKFENVASNSTSPLSCEGRIFKSESRQPTLLFARRAAGVGQPFTPLPIDNCRLPIGRHRGIENGYEKSAIENALCHVTKFRNCCRSILTTG